MLSSFLTVLLLAAVGINAQTTTAPAVAAAATINNSPVAVAVCLFQNANATTVLQSCGVTATNAVNLLQNPTLDVATCVCKHDAITSIQSAMISCQASSAVLSAFTGICYGTSHTYATAVPTGTASGSVGAGTTTVNQASGGDAIGIVISGLLAALAVLLL
ncbi:hypothetical protein HDU98_000038 [Podochytrium sp. JEL0797]|nr:hypothetical protein HDU98_000038 [Podochytrium sp. JEL0797]